MSKQIQSEPALSLGILAGWLCVLFCFSSDDKCEMWVESSDEMFLSF